MEALGPYHPLIVHTPVALLSFSAAVAILGRLFDREWVRQALYLSGGALLVIGIAARKSPGRRVARPGLLCVRRCAAIRFDQSSSISPLRKAVSASANRT